MDLLKYQNTKCMSWNAIYKDISAENRVVMKLPIPHVTEHNTDTSEIHSREEHCLQNQRMWETDSQDKSQEADFSLSPLCVT